MNEKNLKYYVLGTFLVVVLVIGYFIWQSGNLPDNGSGADAVRNELKQTGSAIGDAENRAKSIEAGLDRSETAITNSQSGIKQGLERIDSIQARTATIEAGLDQVERELRESKSIVRTVRERGEENAKKID